MNQSDEDVVLKLIELKVVNVVVITYKLALHYNLKSRNVLILDNYKYDGLEKRYVDYIDRDSSRCMVLLHTPKKEYFKKFLFEPIPVESHLNHYLANHLNAEIVSKNILST